MAVILLVLGILATGAGIVTIGFGIPISEFTLGNTLIVSGTIALSAGLILIGLAAAVGQLTQIAQALRPRAGSRSGRVPDAVEQVAPAGARPAQGKAPILAPPKADLHVPEPPVAEPAPDFSATAIERLRSSLGRVDRKAGETGDAEEVPLSPAVPAHPARPGAGAANGAAPGASGGAVDALKKPRLDFLFRSKPRAAPAPSFDKVWPQPGSRQPDARAAEDDAEPLPSGDARTPIQRPPPDAAPEPDEFRPPAILKSGVVDGMAYTLYADGSIEAQLPQGTVRFGSIAELRAHIDNNS
jgi:hypothetical protein